MSKRRPSAAPQRGFLTFGRVRTFLGSVAALCGMACSTHHWAEVAANDLPAPPAERVLHTDRLIVELSSESGETQCVVDDGRHPVCFYNLRSTLEHGLAQSLWPAFPQVVVGKAQHKKPRDYVLQVEVLLDALPPDDAGPGWSAGARSRYRLLREGKVLSEETLASRSRAHFPYGSSLGEGATEVIDATILHISRAVSEVPETYPYEALPLPKVASRKVSAPDKRLRRASPADSAGRELAKSAEAQPKSDQLRGGR